MELTYDKQVLQGLLAGIDKLANTVKLTLGPKGRNVALYQKANLQNASYSDPARADSHVLITNDGALSHELLSPKKHVDKTYFAEVMGKIGQAEVIKFKEGLVIDTEFTALPAVLEVLSFDEAKNTSRIRVTIHEGKFHQVKRMFEAVGSEVLYLKRLSMGTLVLDESLAPGAYRRLTEQEIQMLKETRNIKKNG